MRLHALTSTSAELSSYATKLSFFIYILLSYIVLELGPIPSLLFFTPLSTSRLFVHNRVQQKLAIENVSRINRTRRHAIVFDAGSTGTRIHVFEFFEKDGFTLEAEHFNQVKPGLSSYENNPLEAGNSLIPLLKVANSVVPENEKQRTPIILRATAGLRLLDAFKADSIVSSVKTFLRMMKPSYYHSEESVSILDGESEGIYSWFSVNFLLNSIESVNSVSVLDLGGGSTQVTFAPLHNTTMRYFSDYIKSTSMFNKKKKLYTRSYLGYGLMSARKSIIHTKLKPSNNLTQLRRVELKHPCFETNKVVEWTFENVNYSIEGEDGDCLQTVKQFLDDESENGFQSPVELNEKSIYAISFYYDRALEIGLIDGHTRGEHLTVLDFHLAALELCDALGNEIRREDIRFEQLRQRKRTILDQNPFICVDMTYISTFLNSRLKLNLNKQITVVNKIDEVGTSWALGAAFSLLNS